MTQPRIHVGPAGDAERFLATDHVVWFQEIPAASAEEQLIGLADEDRFAAEIAGSEPGSYPGIYGIIPMTLSIPGAKAGVRQVPCAGLTWVGVHPDHRRRGVLNAMMRHHIEQVHAQDGVHVSALHASEPAIYGRFGYGPASLELEVSLGRGTTLTAPGLEAAAEAISTSLVSVTDPDAPERLRRCHHDCAGLGSVVGDPRYYTELCHLRPERLRDKEPWRLLFARRDGRDVGFALFRRTAKWERARPAAELVVWSVIGEPAAQLVLLRRLVDFDLVGTVTVRTVDLDDPLLYWVGGPRATSDVATYDSLWVRLVDLREALQERAWSAPCDVVVEVDDTTAPWNAGRWRIRADDSGVATVQKSNATPAVRLPVAALGAAYLGANNLLAWHRAGLVEELRAGAVATLWRAMRTDIAPRAAIMF